MSARKKRAAKRKPRTRKGRGPSTISGDPAFWVGVIEKNARAIMDAQGITGAKRRKIEALLKDVGEQERTARATPKKPMWSVLGDIEGSANLADVSIDALEAIEDSFGTIEEPPDFDHRKLYASLVVVRKALQEAHRELREGLRTAYELAREPKPS